ncbi:CheR family methyltransferase [Oleiagrimonas sp. C23AA]|uniref:CheR family methyltransferase n=1 Tax=Oleiagrimonas sp. C23AA TaxID=2719047 RepID=UPI0014218C70|nr:CheR family methyltransferase [Oleiagrimonas sp. C23AA]NII11100.1 response regulator [Oleiagrimonas sp. C23AA]
MQGLEAGRQALDESVQMTPDPAKRTSPSAPEPDRPVVAVGGAAGGLAPLTIWLRHLRADLGAAFVVTCPLDSCPPSELVPTLARYTPMPVTETSSLGHLHANHIYVLLPGRDMPCADGHEDTSASADESKLHRPIDDVFQAVAAMHPGGFAVLFSGEGTDGTQGIRAIKAQGGMTLVQEPVEAAYASMPRNAIASGCVDVVAPAERLAAALSHRLGHARHRKRTRPEAEQAIFTTMDTALRAIVAHLQQQSGDDFSTCEHSTLLRCVHRRMQLGHFRSMQAYVGHLREHDAETRALHGDLLASVTAFFRDPSAFQALQTQVIEPLASATPAGRTIRFWVPGCATGEEAYSLAMLMQEAHVPGASPCDFQIFATDLDTRVLNAARQGRYPRTIQRHVSAQRLERFFTREGDHFRVAPSIRDQVIFARHNLLGDPPFSHLDLISCRNLLVHLAPDAQERVLTTLRWALNDEGYLFLGPTDSTERTPEAYRVIDATHRIYQARRASDSNEPPHPDGVPPTYPLSSRPPLAGAGRKSPPAITRLAPPGVLVDKRRQVLGFYGAMARFLDTSSLSPGVNLIEQIAPPLRPALECALDAALLHPCPYLSEPVDNPCAGAWQRLVLHAQPIRSDRSDVQVLITFLDTPPAAEPGAESNPNQRRRHSLRVQLERVRKQLRFSQRHQETTRDELKATQDALQLARQDYRLAHDAWQADHTELQSLNQELQTLNNELKLKVARLTQSNAHLNNLMQTMEGGALFVDAQLHIRLFTPAMTQMFDLTTDAVGKSIADVPHHVPYASLIKDIRQVLGQRDGLQREVDTTSGQRLLLRMRPCPLGEGEGVAISLMDVTELHQARKALQESESRFRALLIATSYAIYRMSPDWTQMRELNGRGFLADTPAPNASWLETYIAPDDRSMVRMAIDQAIRDKSTFQLEHRVKRPDGSLGWTLSRAVPLLDERGAIIEWFGTASDVTQLHRAREELARANRMEIVGRMAGGIAHDFNNLLTVIVANLELAEEHIRDQAIRRWVEQAAKAAQLGASFNKRLLSLAGKHHYAPQHIDINHRINDLTALLERALGEPIVLCTRLDDDLWPTYVDPMEIDSALLNLALNARDAMTHGGCIVIRTRNVTLDAGEAAHGRATRPGDYVCLEVTDSGTGMSKETLSRATEAFFSTKENDLGAGLGLFSVHSFVKQARGYLELTSEPGQGTCVRLYLPRANPARHEVTVFNDHATEPPRGRGELILIVEDDDTVSEVARQLLQTLGYAVQEARNAEQAIEKLTAQTQIRLVLSDIVMPGQMSGIDLARWIGRERPAVKVILTTGYSTDVAHGMLADLRHIQVLTKPYTRQALGDAIGHALNAA